MHIDWLPSFLRNSLTVARYRAHKVSRRRPASSVARISEKLEERAMLAGNSLLGGLLNLPPLTLPDTFNVLQNDTLSSVTSILQNDTDPNGDPLNAQVLVGPLNGTLNLLADGTFTYIPTDGFIGIDTFLYTASDGLLGSLLPGLVTLNVLPLTSNRPPVANDDVFSVAEDSVLNLSLGTALSGVLANDTDEDILGLTELLELGDLVLTAALVQGPQHGTLLFLPTGTFIYTPNPDFVGVDTFTYQASDVLSLSNVATVQITVGDVNDAPVAADDSYSTSSIVPLVVPSPTGVLANDTDVDSSSLTALLESSPSNGVLLLAPDGSFVYTPDIGFTGTDTFTYRASDGQSQSEVATVTITVTAELNTPPVAVADAYVAVEDELLSIVLAGGGVLANDVDLESDPLTAILVSGPANGNLVLNADGTFTYTPGANFVGVDSFTYQANDGTANSNVTTVLLTVVGGNDSPLAINDAFSTDEETTLTVTAPGVLLNDVDPESDPLQAVLVAGPAHGVLVLSPNGSFTYTPNPNFNGADSFTYRSTDGTDQSNVATVTITVNPVNDLPVANNDSYIADEDTALVIGAPAGVLANDIDPDGQSVTAVLVTSPENGSVVLLPDGSLVYTPDADFSGTDTFTYAANDGVANGNPATVTITVENANDLPAAVADTYSVNEDAVLNISALAGVLSNDTDPDDDPLTAILVSGAANGVVTLNPDGSFQYTPDLNYSGSDSFTYRVNDSQANSNSVTVTINVNAVNDAPQAVNDSYQVNEDATLTVQAATGVLVNDLDPDGDTVTAAIDTVPANGTVVLQADGSFVYTPDANFSGTDSFVYRASDSLGTGTTAQVFIVVTGQNDAPVAVSDSYTVANNGTLNLTAPGVLGNDIDRDGDALTAILVAGTTTGTLVLSADGALVYVPQAGFTGLESFTYRVTDGQIDSVPATVTILVTPPNDLPSAVNDAYATNQGTPLTVSAPGVLGNDSDANNDSLTAVLVSGPANGTLTLNSDGSFTYTPTGAFSGADSFSYRASDGMGQSNVATVTITVAGQNEAPVAVNDTYSVQEDGVLTVLVGSGVLVNDSDPDVDTLMSLIVSQPASGTVSLSADGAFVYTPNANFQGTDSFTYRASDGSLTSGLATVSITVVGVNDAPVGVADTYSVNEDSVLTALAPQGVLANDSDADGTALTAQLVTGTAQGTLVLNPDGGFVYTPVANFSGTDTFTYRVSDGTSNSTPITVTINVLPQNDAPVSVADTYTTNEDTVLTVGGLAGVLANDTDADGTPLSAILVTSPQNGTLVLNSDGSLVYTPNVGFSGTDTFTYRASDGTLNGNAVAVTINVESQSDTPVIVTSNGTTTARARKKMVLDPAVDLIDADSPNFNGGSLDLAIQSGAGTKDFIGFRKGGANKGRVNAKRGQLRVGKVVIGSITGGVRGTPVHIEFNSNATQERVETVLRNVIFRGTKGQVTQRIVALRVKDDTGLLSNLATKSVNQT